MATVKSIRIEAVLCDTIFLGKAYGCIDLHKVDPEAYVRSLEQYARDISAGFMIFSGEKPWNADPRNAENFLIETPRMSFELLHAGCEIAEGKTRAHFSFWEYSGATLMREDAHTLSLVDETSDKKVTPHPYLEKIYFNASDFFAELQRASDELILFLEKFIALLSDARLEEKQKKYLAYDIALEIWKELQERLKKAL